jgi:hypothetical protein
MAYLQENKQICNWDLLSEVDVQKETLIAVFWAEKTYITKFLCWAQV